MRNVREEQLKKAIFMENTEFFELAREFNLELDEDEYVGEILRYGGEDEVIEAFSKYYDVNITSIHSDTFDCAGVWLVYKD